MSDAVSTEPKGPSGPAVMWRSIDERGGSAEAVVLRGIPVKLPKLYEKRRRLSRLSVAGIAALLMRFITLSTATVAHLIIAIFFLLVLTIKQAGDDDSTVNIGMAGWRQGEEGLLDKKDKEKAEEKKEEEKEEAVPEKEKEKPKEEEKPEEPEKVETVKKEEKKEEEPEPEDDSKEDPNSVVNGKSKDPVRPAPIGAGSSNAGKRLSGKDAAKLIEKDPIAAVRARRKGVLDQLRKGRESDILVVEGGYDRVEKVLEKLGIPHRTVTSRQLADLDLSKVGVILINCDNRNASPLSEQGSDLKKLKGQVERTKKRIKDLRKMIERTSSDSRRTRYRRELRLQQSYLRFYERGLARAESSQGFIKKLRGFLGKGGYLFTSDWGLTILEEVCPGKIKRGGTVGPKTVPIRAPSSKRKHPLLEEVFPPGKKDLRWEIDSSSYLIKKGYGSRVTTLVESTRLGSRKSVAVVFSYKKGKVLHVLSHFYRQASKRGEYALQNLLLNFLVDRLLRGQ